jgi:hypothetical protein
MLYSPRRVLPILRIRKTRTSVIKDKIDLIEQLVLAFDYNISAKGLLKTHQVVSK